MLRRYSYWLLPLIAGVLVALVGARLLTLSVRERSQRMRVTALTAAVRHARLVDAQLPGLAGRAREEAGRLQNTAAAVTRA